MTDVNSTDHEHEPGFYRFQFMINKYNNLATYTWTLTLFISHASTRDVDVFIDQLAVYATLGLEY